MNRKIVLAGLAAVTLAASAAPAAAQGFSVGVGFDDHPELSDVKVERLVLVEHVDERM